LTSCIVWGNHHSQLVEGFEVVHSCIEGGYPGGSNIDQQPLFADPNTGDYHLQSQAGRWDPTRMAWVTDSVTSPCIDAGHPSPSYAVGENFQEFWGPNRRCVRLDLV
jgi:hypothetical protein